MTRTTPTIMPDGSTEAIKWTAEQEAVQDAEEAQAAIDQQARAEAEIVRLAKKASGKQKLKDLGLDDDEVKQLTGA